MGISFRLPKQAVHRTLRRYGGWLAALAGGLLLTSILTDGGQTHLDVLAIIASALLFYVVVRSFAWVTITPHGIEGPLRPNYSRTRLAWDDELAIRSTTYLGLRCVDLIAANGSESIRIPTEISQRLEFQNAVVWLSPPGHVLRRLSVSAAQPLGQAASPPWQPPSVDSSTE